MYLKWKKPMECNMTWGKSAGCESEEGERVEREDDRRVRHFKSGGKKKIGVDGQKGIRPQGKPHRRPRGGRWGWGGGGWRGGGGEVENTCAVRCLQITTGKKCSHAFLTLELWIYYSAREKMFSIIDNNVLTERPSGFYSQNNNQLLFGRCKLTKLRRKLCPCRTTAQAELSKAARVWKSSNELQLLFLSFSTRYICFPHPRPRLFSWFHFVSQPQLSVWFTLAEVR